MQPPPAPARALPPTARPTLPPRYDRIWSHTWVHFADHAQGSWFRALGRDCEKLDVFKCPQGKVDYHAVGCMLSAGDSMAALGAAGYPLGARAPLKKSFGGSEAVEAPGTPAPPPPPARRGAPKSVSFPPADEGSFSFSPESAAAPAAGGAAPLPPARLATLDHFAAKPAAAQLSASRKRAAAPAGGASPAAAAPRHVNRMIARNLKLNEEQKLKLAELRTTSPTKGAPADSAGEASPSPSRRASGKLKDLGASLASRASRDSASEAGSPAKSRAGMPASPAIASPARETVSAAESVEISASTPVAEAPAE